ncbi:hypothetical protein DLAC_09395 [Tieghemostelium lacteum]|uniref:Uncharacterized protein n=1 Tax=Tieghemostelium lacteum TaxID=361077 RepID=A0A151Z9Y9_TIELA|nr:hypothetical protein DLAC_09395 [Tieghemostelium lacteum]|eukprot:KYQ90757.1 hypothetical protein DLAC_09395 [Tieghemostelium lacteum]
MKYLVVLLVILVTLLSSGVHGQLSCCATSQWQGSSLSSTTNGPVFRNYYYDGQTRTTRLDIISEYINQTTFSFYPNITQTGIEWVYDAFTGECYQTGPDYWNSWCFGDDFGTPFVNADFGVYIFANPSNGLTVYADMTYCTPVLMDWTYSGVSSTFVNVLPEITDFSVFDMPAACSSGSSSS